MTGALVDIVRDELAGIPHREASAVAGELAAMGRGGVAAILYYGSALRARQPNGVLDFYVLLDDQKSWPRTRLGALANAVLPPNVEFREFVVDETRLRAKIAILSLPQFEAMTRGEGLDTTVWARFSQPSVLAWSRDAAAREAVAAAVAEALVTAARFAAALGPREGRADTFWSALFKQTYAAELRVERKGREKSLMAFAAPRYGVLTPLAWTAAGIGFHEGPQGLLRPVLGEAERRRLLAAWTRRRKFGKPLNILRLAKAVFTFEGAARYAAWKIRRHTGLELEVTPWRERHPILAAPGVAWRLWREGVFGQAKARALPSPEGAEA